MSDNRDLGIVIYGATGYTGKLVAEYMNKQYGANGDVKWAMAGRSLEKLQAVRDELNIPAEIELIVADAADPASMKSLASRTRVMLTTVGPYQLYGSDLVEACAVAGTDYVDLCGEPAWMHQMIAAYAGTAQASGARIVFSCGFDSIPFDLGVFYLQQAAQKALGGPASRVKGRVRAMKGTFSGGTQASFKATLKAAMLDHDLVAVLRDPFSLSEGFSGPKQPAGARPEYDPELGSWAAPFVMATINTKNVHRSNFLLGHPYGKDFIYDEMVLTGPGEKGESIAREIAADNSMANDPRAPGEGPSREERETGYYDLLFIGTMDDGRTISASVKGDMDPGYGSTSKMMVESAVCLLKNPAKASGGIWTAAAALGSSLIERLEDNAGMSFEIESG